MLKNDAKEELRRNIEKGHQRTLKPVHSNAEDDDDDDDDDEVDDVDEYLDWRSKKVYK